MLAGLLLDAIGRRSFLPRVTLLICLGVLIGPSLFNLLPPALMSEFDLITSIALAMVGFMLGGRLTLEALREFGKEIFWISLIGAIGTCLIVAIGLLAIGQPIIIALLLAGIATATAPAAVADVVSNFKTESPFATKLLDIVALDDVWGLIIFSICVAFALITDGNHSVLNTLGIAGFEIGGAILLGVLLGVPASYLTGRITAGEPSLAEALGIVFICSGLALWLEVSFLIASMTLGIVVTNLAKHHTRPFHEIKGVEGPVLVLFFVLAGATLQIDSLAEVGPLLIFYVLFRFLAKLMSGWLGAKLAGSNAPTRRWIGLALTPQAGVAMGMVLIAVNRFPQQGTTVLPVILASTVIFELTGPILTRLAISREAQQSTLE
ncbi:cation:proton antiporter [Lentisphaera profundi]|uniref:Cation:proton antiporter n=2 Tax=Lentisphaera profundi TaxID=1658616 RepID=A0ABY7VTN4_9BACT|nr:cation:proton antiporter [Lentisphaera profundi]WDE97427.1 cation:proton antiporter [Lentisphaera profundi]